MTAVKRLSLEEMIEETGIPNALGYARPDEDEILIREDLDKATEKKVMAHEANHIANDEEGPFIGAIISGVTSMVGGQQQAGQQRQAAELGADVADPFRHYRGPFQEMLLNLYGFTVTSPGSSSRLMDWDERMATGLEESQRAFWGEEGLEGHLFETAMSDPFGFMDPNAGYVPGTPPTIGRLPGGPAGAELFQRLPGYQFNLRETTRAGQRAAAAGGLSRSGNLAIDLATRASGLAEQTYGQEISRLMALAGVGAGSPASAGQLLGGGYGAAAESTTAGLLGLSNALGGAFGGGGSNTNVNIGGGTTDWGDTYVQTDYGPVITDMNY